MMYYKISLGMITLFSTTQLEIMQLSRVLYCFLHYLQTSYHRSIFSLSDAEIISKQATRLRLSFFSSILFFCPQTERWHLYRHGLFRCCLLLQCIVLIHLKTTRSPVCAQEAQVSQDLLGCTAAPVSPAGMDETAVTLNKERKGKEGREENQVQKYQPQWCFSHLLLP